MEVCPIQRRIRVQGFGQVGVEDLISQKGQAGSTITDQQVLDDPGQQEMGATAMQLLAGKCANMHRHAVENLGSAVGSRHLKTLNKSASGDIFCSRAFNAQNVPTLKPCSLKALRQLANAHTLPQTP